MADLPLPLGAGFVVSGLVCMLIWRVGRRVAERKGREREARVLRNMQRYAPVIEESMLHHRKLDGDCCVCLNDLAGSSLRMGLCGHVFHSLCLEQWVLYSVNRYLDIDTFVRVPHSGVLVPGTSRPSCPLCKKMIPVIDQLDYRDALFGALCRYGPQRSAITFG